MKQRHIRVPYKLLDSDVSNEAKKLFVTLMQVRTGTNKQIHVTIKTLADRAGLQERQVKKHIRTLCECNVLSRKQRIYGDGAWGCNTYTILCDETYFAEIPYPVASDSQLSAQALIAYCTLKRFTNLDKKDYICRMNKKRLAKEWKCSLSHVDKVKRMLKQAGYIDYQRNQIPIILSYEQQINF